jgi:hypothetical protein
MEADQILAGILAERMGEDPNRPSQRLIRISQIAQEYLFIGGMRVALQTTSYDPEAKVLDIRLITENGAVTPSTQRILFALKDSLVDLQKKAGFAIIVPTAEQASFKSAIDTLNNFGIQTITADTADEIKKALDNPSIVYTLKGQTQEDIDKVKEGLTNEKDSYALIDPGYTTLGPGALYLSVMARRLAHDNQKKAIAVGYFSDPTSPIAQFVKDYNLVVYRIKAIWQYLSQMLLAKRTAERAA